MWGFSSTGLLVLTSLQGALRFACTDIQYIYHLSRRCCRCGIFSASIVMPIINRTAIWQCVILAQDGMEVCRFGESQLHALLQSPICGRVLAWLVISSLRAFIF